MRVRLHANDYRTWTLKLVLEKSKFPSYELKLPHSKVFCQIVWLYLPQIPPFLKNMFNHRSLKNGKRSLVCRNPQMCSGIDKQ